MANVLKMATVADIVTLIQAGSSDRRISALLSLDRGTVAKYRRQLQLDKSLTLPSESVHPKVSFYLESWGVRIQGLAT